MKDPRLPFQSSAITAIEAALVAHDATWSSDRVFVDPENDQPYPYVHITDSSVIEGPTFTKDGPGQEFTMTFVAWSDSYGEAANAADQTIQSITDLSSPITIAGFTVVYDHADWMGPPLRDEINPDDVIWGFPVRVRYIVTQN